MGQNHKAPDKPAMPIEQRILILETKLRSFKVAVAIIAPSVALVFGLLGIALAWNVGSERDDLRDFRKETKEDVQASLGHISDEPEIVLSTQDGQALEGAVLEPKFESSTGDPTTTKIEFPIIIRNIGKAWTGNDVAIKIYTPKAIPGNFQSTDEKSFAFETYWIGENDTGLSRLPAGFSTIFLLTIFVNRDQNVLPGRYDCLVKFYYGRGKIARSTFTAYFKEPALKSQ